MATYKRFEDLPVWQAAVEAAAKMFTWTEHHVFRGQGDLANQLQRATLSISNNIAEGFERGTTNELLHFLYIARGSAGEVRSMLAVISITEKFKVVQPAAELWKLELESISRQLRAWADSLQNSEIEGQKFLNDASRARYRRKESSRAFFDRQKEFRDQMEARLKREAAERHRDEE